MKNLGMVKYYNDGGSGYKTTDDELIKTNTSGNSAGLTGATKGPTFAELRKTYDQQLYDSWLGNINAQYGQAKKNNELAYQQKKGYATTRQAQMKKYVPETLRAMGLNNNGLAEDALIGMENNYTNYIMGAKAEKANADNTAWEQLKAAQRQMEAQKAQDNMEWLNTQEQAYLKALDLASTGNTSEEYLRDYMNNYGLSETHQADAYELLKQAAAKMEQAETATQTTYDFESLAEAVMAGSYPTASELLWFTQKGYITADEKAKLEKLKGAHELFEDGNMTQAQYEAIFNSIFGENATSGTESIAQKKEFGIDANTTNFTAENLGTVNNIYKSIATHTSKAEAEKFLSMIQDSINWGSERNGTELKVINGRKKIRYVFFDGIWYAV